MNDEMIRQMASMYNIPEEELIKMLMQGSPEMSGIEAGYNQQQGVPAPGEPGRMSAEEAAMEEAKNKARVQEMQMQRKRPDMMDFQPPRPNMNIFGKKMCSGPYSYDEATDRCVYVGERGKQVQPLELDLSTSF
jgi:hypothetical protein